MKPGISVDVREEIAEVHTTARSPSPKQKSKTRPRSRSGRKLSNEHVDAAEGLETSPTNGVPSTDKSKRDSWIKSEHESVELPIHDQINQGIMAFVEKEIKKSDKNPAFVFYSHDPNGLDEKVLKTLSRPSSGHKEKRSPSYRKKKRHSSKHRDSVYNDFDVPGSSLSALEKVDDYLKEYNKDEVVTLSGELEIEPNDVENNNGTSKEIRHKPRKTRRKTRDERQDSNANGKDVSPKVFKAGNKSKSASKPARPTDLTAMLQTLESSLPYHEQYIDNPFSSPSPVTSPNDERMDPFRRRPEKIYMQGGGTFRAVSRDRILESQQSREGDKYLRMGDATPLDVGIAVQKAWRGFAPACHGILGGLALMHLLLISYSDGLDAGHLSFHAVVTMPYVAAYYFFCVLCLLSVLDRLDVTSIDMSAGLQPYFQPLVLATLYSACLLVCAAARVSDDLIVYQLDVTSIDMSAGLQPYFQPLVLATLYSACLLVCAAARVSDDLIVYQYAPLLANITTNATHALIPTFYHTWTHFSIWRAILSILGLVYFVISNPPDLVYNNLSKLLQFKQSLQSIG